jgi:arabinan endo-1,5-alpha-L-arabinosidase
MSMKSKLFSGQSSFRTLALLATLGALWSAAGCGSSTDQPNPVAGAGPMAGASPGFGGGGGGIASAGAPAAGSGAAGSTNTGGSAAGDSSSAGAVEQSGGAGTGGDSAGGAGGSMAGGSSGGSVGGCPSPGAGPVTSSSTHLDIGVHDPAVIWNGARYDLFATGGKLNIRSSTNLQQWTNVGDVFSKQPAWIATALGSAPADLWAPDVSFFNCQYHVYYAGSSFGSNNSVIGLATSPTLDSTSADYKWTDQGQVVRSMSSDNYNAIDPNLAFDDAGDAWLSFGSFWSGIKMRKIDVATGKASTSDTTLYALASRTGEGAVEAPSIISHNGFYYLFVSYDSCCKGVDSTYRTMVGRATKITGPYTNKAGAAMTTGAAEELIASAGRYIGPGGGTAFRNGSTYLYAFHYYDGMDNGASKLQVRPINFDTNDWPTLGAALFP